MVTKIQKYWDMTYSLACFIGPQSCCHWFLPTKLLWENTGLLATREHISYHVKTFFFKVSGAGCMSKMQLLEGGLWKGYKSTANLKCIKNQLLECVVLDKDTNR